MNKPFPKFWLHLLNAFLGLFLVSGAKAQIIQVTQGQTNFTCNSSSTLENAQVAVNAFSVAVFSFYSFSVYVKVSNVSSSAGAAMPASMLAVKLNTVSPSRTANYNTFTLSTNNQQLIQSTNTGLRYVTYTYNLIAGPVGYDYPPGSQLFNVLFTLTYP